MIVHRQRDGFRCVGCCYTSSSESSELSGSLEETSLFLKILPKQIYKPHIIKIKEVFQLCCVSEKGLSKA